jgi:hypothetical protein
MPAESLRHASLAFALLAIAGSAHAGTDVTELPAGRFRITRGVAAPWLDASATAPDTRAWLGRTVEFGPRRFVAPAGLSCDDARYETDQRPPEGLFQGNLPAPADVAAANLGLLTARIPSVTLTCSTGLYDLHWATPQLLLFALDNVIWTLDRSPGASATPASAEGVVQVMLETHFAGDMGFTPESVADKRPWLSAALFDTIQAYFARPQPEDEAPVINGDPFTDSQEYPHWFSVGAAVAADGATRVPVRYGDGLRERRVTFLLVREDHRWRIDDVLDERGDRLRRWLTGEAP